MQEFHRVADMAEIPDPGRMLVEVEGEVVALFHVDGGFYAIDDICTHDGGTLAEGQLDGFKIACPRHGARFDVRTGAALSMPAVRPTRAHAVKVADGGVWVALGAVAGQPGPAPFHSGPGSTLPAGGQPASLASASATPASGGTWSGPPTAAPAGQATSTGTAPSSGHAPSPDQSSDQSPTPAAGAGTAAGAVTEEAVREWLKEVKDPELFVNVVDLGLIYGVTLSPAADAPDRQHCVVDMTMTSPACPAGPQLIADTKRAVGSRSGIAAVEVRIVMDPPWTPDRMTDAARDQLGIF
jgi:metal-sulfur cluster biosynthetic enzyme/nitrite reductase/ring-hydroxylating ferredoxin subunit